MKDTVKGIAAGVIVLGAGTQLLGLDPSMLIGLGLTGSSLVGMLLINRDTVEERMSKIFRYRKFRVVADDGSEIYPELVKRERTEYGHKLVYRLPLGISDEDLLKIYRGIEIGTNSELDMYEENGEIIMKLYSHPLPSRPIPFDRRVVTPGLLPGSGNMILPVVIGRSRAGFEYFDLAKAPSVLVGGETGGGKTTLLRVMIANLVNKCDLYVVDVTRKLGYVKNHGWFESEYEGIDHLLSHLCQEMYTRYKEFESMGVDEIEGLGEEKAREYPRIVLIIDEYNGLSPSLIKHDAEEKARRGAIISKIASLITRGRGCGIHLVIGLQRPDAKIMEDGQIKACLPIRIAFKTTDGSNSRIILDSSLAATIPADIPGRCILRAKDRIRQVQVFNLDYQTAKKLLPAERRMIMRSIPDNPLEFLLTS